MFIGIDCGFSSIKYATGSEYGKFITAIAEVRGIDVGIGDGIYKYDGRYYYVGEMAMKQGSSNIINITTYDALEYYMPLFIVHTLKTLNVNHKKIKGLCLGLSPSHLKNIDRFKQRCSKFNVNETQYEFIVDIMAQGVGAVYALSAQGLLDKEDVIIVDGGFNTLDLVFVLNSVIQANRINADNAFENKGVINIASEVVDYVQKTFFKTITIKEAQEVLETGVYKFRGKKHDISEVIAEFKQNYTKNLILFIEKHYNDIIDKMEGLYIVGGLGYMVDTSTLDPEIYPDGFVQTFANSEYLNAMGNYIRIKEKRSEQ